MVSLFGKGYKREELRERVGDIRQICGVRRFIFSDGPEKGVEAIEFRTGAGLRFLVLPDRGMDISMAEFKGVPLSWISSVGEVSPHFFEPEDFGWLRTFYGGLLTTCGLTYAGAPCVDKGKRLGLHGRASCIPARDVTAGGDWEGEDYVMRCRGKVRETSVFGEDLLLKREITTRLGGSSLRIHDIVENMGYEPVEHMIIYHINLGFPVVDDGSLLISPTLELIPRDEEAREGMESYNRFHAPIQGYKEKVYYHKLAHDGDGWTSAAIVNEGFDGGKGIGVYVRFNLFQLPNLVEWKMMGRGMYVVGVEPANCLVEGRDVERERGTLVILDPGERREYELEIGVLSSRDEIDGFKRSVESILEMGRSESGS
jgi:hypothetical protein